MNGFQVSTHLEFENIPRHKPRHRTVSPRLTWKMPSAKMSAALMMVSLEVASVISTWGETAEEPMFTERPVCSWVLA